MKYEQVVQERLEDVLYEIIQIKRQLKIMDLNFDSLVYDPVEYRHLTKELNTLRIERTGLEFEIERFDT